MRAAKWGLAISGLLALVAGIATWQRQRDVAHSFEELAPRERRLAIYDAFADAVERNYYDRQFIATQWPVMRAEWRVKAADAKDDAALYFQVLQQLQQKFPSSHVSAMAPGSVFPGTRPQAFNARGFEVAGVRRGTRVRYFVGDLRPGAPAVEAGIEPGWQVADLPVTAGEYETGLFFDEGSPEQRFEYETGARWDRRDSDDWQTSQAAFEAENGRRVRFRRVSEPAVEMLSIRTLDAGVTHIRLGTFEIPLALDKTLEALDRAGQAGVVLDMRSNGGGLVEQEMRLLDRLLPEHLLVGKRVGVDGTIESRTRAGRKYRGPLVVLIGPGTGSAAECVAAALQDHGRARLLGRSTAGMVLTARVLPLPGGGSIAVAYADFVRSNGRRIEGIGVMPDVPVMPTNADVRAGRDPALERALLELRRPPTTVSTGNRPPAA